MTSPTPTTGRRRSDTLDPGAGERRVAAAAAPMRRAGMRPLSWRNPWTLLLGVLAAFQAGVITTLLWTSGAADKAMAPQRETASSSGDRTSPTTASPTPADPRPAAAAPAPPAASGDRTASAAAPAPPPPPSGASGTRRQRPRATEPVAPVAPDAPDDAQGLVEVDIRSEPEGATVKIAGAVWGQTPLTALLPAARPVDIKLELAGHAPATLRWTPARKRSLRTVLSPLETP